MSTEAVERRRPPDGPPLELFRLPCAALSFLRWTFCASSRNTARARPRARASACKGRAEAEQDRSYKALPASGRKVSLCGIEASTRSCTPRKPKLQTISGRGGNVRDASHTRPPAVDWPSPCCGNLKQRMGTRLAPMRLSLSLFSAPSARQGAGPSGRANRTGAPGRAEAARVRCKGASPTTARILCERVGRCATPEVLPRGARLVQGTRAPAWV